MTNKESNIKQLALRAKKRLKMQTIESVDYYKELIKEKRERKNSYMANYYLKKIDRSSEIELEKQISAALENEGRYPCTLQTFIDRSKFQKLDDVQRVRYIISLSSIYRKQHENKMAN